VAGFKAPSRCFNPFNPFNPFIAFNPFNPLTLQPKVKNNRVNLPETSKEKQDIVISSHSDGFFKENMYANYGAYSYSVCLFVAMCRFISACISGFLFSKKWRNFDISRVFFSFFGFWHRVGTCNIRGPGFVHKETRGRLSGGF
jgi:hypothetical protein